MKKVVNSVIFNLMKNVLQSLVQISWFCFGGNVLVSGWIRKLKMLLVKQRQMQNVVFSVIMQCISCDCSLSRCLSSGVCVLLILWIFSMVWFLYGRQWQLWCLVVVFGCFCFYWWWRCNCVCCVCFFGGWLWMCFYDCVVLFVLFVFYFFEFGFVDYVFEFCVEMV